MSVAVDRFVGPVDASVARPHRLRFGSRYRWVRDSNGHPGRCGEDCWHATPEKALDCFRGER